MSWVKDIKALAREKGNDEGWWQDSRWQWARELKISCPSCNVPMSWIGISSKDEALFMCLKCRYIELIKKEDVKGGVLV